MVLDPESNWDICPVCMKFFYAQLFPPTDASYTPSRERMREYHLAHKQTAEDYNPEQGDSTVNG